MRTPDVNTSPGLGLSDSQVNSCIHCGLCLENCPTFSLTGDENNSPRGRLNIWKAIDSGRIVQDETTDFYTDECVGCLACEPVCPANVPYGNILETVRASRSVQGKRNKLSVELAAWFVKKPKLFNRLGVGGRLLRKFGLLPHPLLFPGNPAVLESSAVYARKLMAKYKPTGPRVALLAGCLMEALFREINYATIRVLVQNNIQVVLPVEQGCCGAFLEHTGIAGVDKMRDCNRLAFSGLEVDAVVSNSAGCGLALKHVLGDDRVRDVLDFLDEHGLAVRPKRKGAKVFVDVPCHLLNGQRKTISPNVLNATGIDWQYAPCYEDCCGSGGVYNINVPERASEILRSKSSFLNSVECDELILATANHVCMMQWYSARRFVKRPFRVVHVIQLLDEATK